MKIILLLLFTLLNQISIGSNLFYNIDSLSKSTVKNGLKFISFGSGWGFTSTIVNDPNNFLQQGIIVGNNTYAPYFSYEHGLNKNLAIEVEYSFQKIGMAYRRTYEDQSFYTYYPVFAKHHSFCIGFDSKLLLNKSFNIVNFHAGSFFGFSNSKFNEDPSGDIVEINDPESNKLFYVQPQVENKKIAAFGLYAGISKRIALSKGVLFELQYTQRFGLRNLIEGKFLLDSYELNFSENPASFAVKGGGSFLTVGLKIVIFKN